jgi:HEAT repeat protein
VVTADLVKAVEESTNADVDQFFNQWVYGAGAPKFDISYAYDNAKQKVALTVKQTQKVEGRVGIFRVPMDVEITTGEGAHLYPIVVSKQTETFFLPSTSEPLMVLFDKGGNILKKVEFHKEKKEWLYQLKNAADFSDRADAAVALRTLKEDAGHSEGKAEEKNDDVISALGDSASNDKAWGVRAVASESLGEFGGPIAAKKIIEALNSAKEPWLRARMVGALGSFKDDKDVLTKLQNVAEQDSSYRARAAALQAIGKLKAPNAFAILNSAIAADSPDDFLRNAALRSLGPLGDEKAVPVLREWVVPGKPMETRQAAIFSLARMQKDNKEITTQIASYLPERHFEIRMAAVSALGARGDASAIPALEQLLKSDDLSIEVAPMVKEQIARLKRPAKEKRDGPATAGTNTGDDDDEASGENSSGANGNAAVVADRLDKLEHLMLEMNSRLKTIETRLATEKH